MKIPQHTLICLSTSLLVTSFSQPSLAFNLKPENGTATKLYLQSNTYKYLDKKSGYTFSGIASIDRVEKINLGGTSGLRKLLDPFFDPRWRQWDFKYSKTPLPGTLDILDYVVCVPNIPCGKPLTKKEKNDGKPDTRDRMGVGAYIDIKFTPPSTQKPDLGEIKWIQRVQTNHPLYLSGTGKINSV